MTSKDFMKVWELGKGRNQSRWMMAVVPGQSPFPFPALQNDPLTAINLATAYYRRSDFMKIEGAVGKSQGIPQRRSLSPVQPGHDQPAEKVRPGRPRRMP